MTFHRPKSDLIYLVRDDSVYAYGAEIKPFVLSFCQLLQKYVDHQVVSIDARKQVGYVSEFIDKKYPNCLVISLDKWYRGHFDLIASRVFEKGKNQSKPIDFLIKNEVQFRETLDCWKFFKYKKLLIVDDDISTGYTMTKVCEIIKEYTDVKPGFLSMEYTYRPDWNDRIYDVVDIRDFIPNSLNGGLLCRNEHGDLERVTYLHPNVDLCSRMKLTPENAVLFSIDLIELQKEYFNYNP